MCSILADKLSLPKERRKEGDHPLARNRDTQRNN